MYALTVLYFKFIIYFNLFVTYYVINNTRYRAILKTT